MENVTPDLLLRIVFCLLILAVSWTFVRMLLRLALRVFVFGCGLIFLAAVALIVFRTL